MGQGPTRDLHLNNGQLHCHGLNNINHTHSALVSPQSPSCRETSRPTSMAAATVDATESLSRLPTPDSITLLFKHHKSTTLLSVLPSTPFIEIKALLLAALRSRNITTLPGSPTALPEDAQDLEFGILSDKKDPSQGWVSLEISEDDNAGSRGNKKKVAGKGNAMNQSPTGAGLTDGTWIAYRLKSTSVSSSRDPRGSEPSSPEVEIEEDPGWNVVLPSFDDEMD